MATTPYIGQALPSKIVSTDGVTTLFHVAADQFGDALDWNAIAALNGLNDPWCDATDTLLIPNPPASNNGGVPYG